MRIVHVNDNDGGGGAARAAWRLHRGLLGLGVSSSLYVRQKGGADERVRAFEPPADVLVRLGRRRLRTAIEREFARYARSRPPGYERFSDDRTPWGAAVALQLPPADVVHLHWVAGFVDYGTFLPAAAERAPVVWSLHDMNPITGGCHFSLGCGRYADGCGACPQLGSADDSDLSRRIFERKRKVLESLPQDRLRIAAPSRWLASEAAGSPLLRRFPVSVVPYGIDLDVFAPRDRGVCRDILGIPREGRVLLFVAEALSNRRKGFHLLQRVLQELSGVPGLTVVSVGYEAPPPSGPVRHIDLGYIGREPLLSAVYSAADLFVIPSLQDNLPNTVLESLACGTPVAGFAAGGIPDMVRPGVTGFLAPPEDVDALRAALAGALSDPDSLDRMRGECRRVAREEYSLETQARRFAELYAGMPPGPRGGDPRGSTRAVS